MTDISSSPQEIKLTRVFSRTPSSWDPQDDLLLRHLKEQQKLGWKEIASHFAHRTPNACQFRWRRLRSGSLKSTGSNTSTASSTPGATNVPSAAPTSAAAVNSTASTNNNTTITSTDSSTKAISASPSLSPSMKPTNHLKGLIPQQVKSNSISSTTSSNSSAVKATTAPTNNMANIAYQNWSFNNKTPVSNLINSRDDPDPLTRSVSSSSVSSDGDDDNDTSAVTDSNWTHEEDELLLTRRQRELSFTELSIVLPLRTETQIQSRISELERRSKSTSAISSESPQGTPIKSHTRHSHPHPLHSSSINSPLDTSIRKTNRSYSNSSQTSVASTSSFLNQDSTRSKSFSTASPYPLVFTERYSSRKNSISYPGVSHLIPIQNKQQRSNSMKISNSLNPVNSSLGSLRSLRAGSFGYYNSESISDDEDTTSIHYNTSNIRVEPIKNPVAPLGSLFNDYYAK